MQSNLLICTLIIKEVITINNTIDSLKKNLKFKLNFQDSVFLYYTIILLQYVLTKIFQYLAYMKFYFVYA